MSQREDLRSAIRQMFRAQEALHRAFSKKPFTPDGRMIGDIGEAIAEIEYRVRIDEKIRKHWDGVRENGKGKYPDVQIKATQKDETYLKRPPHDGALLVFHIKRSGEWESYYNGSIMRVWNSLRGRRENKAGEKFITLKKLQELRVPIRERIPAR